MPILDATARAASLANDYGATRAADAPSSFTVRLYVGSPADGGYEMPSTTELDDGSVVSNGYAAPVVSSASFAPTEDGIAVNAQFPAVLAEWPETATHWLLRDQATGVGWDFGKLAEPLDVTAAGAGPLVTCTVFYDDDVSPL